MGKRGGARGGQGLSTLEGPGFQNQSVTVNVRQCQSTLGVVRVNLNFNCNLIWNALFGNIGSTPATVNFTTLTLGKEIAFVTVPKLTASPIVSTRNAAVLAAFNVHYTIPKGVGEPCTDTPTGKVFGSRKGYVNCNSRSLSEHSRRRC
ncbi:hypothetical protein BV898_16380 [Hypsibius exemplaris]|uniref:Uncharacterized protein n=1 Tax=Hypsibius exemplaris TaxID=2072580 RepID=A0A9X6RLF3_HYPEX|nr:hypothetical protein BV898_16380 [Hypsibius exemplaris]